MQDAVQDNGPLAESYNAVLQKQEVDPLKRQRVSVLQDLVAIQVVTLTGLDRG